MMFHRQLSRQMQKHSIDSEAQDSITFDEFSNRSRQQPQRKEEEEYVYHLGNLTKTEELTLTREIEQKIIQERRQISLYRKVLFLGAGESGKSTMIKQLRQQRGRQYTQRQIDNGMAQLRRNAISCIQELARASISLTHNTQITLPTMKIPSTVLEERREILSWDSKQTWLSAEMATMIQTFWQSDLIQEVYLPKYRQYYQLSDNFEYLMRKVTDFCNPSFIPTFDDWVQVRASTTHVRTERFSFNDQTCFVYDVGGQRGQRKKWIHHFDDVDVIMFVASLGGYMQTIAEDGKTNRLLEARQLFCDTLKLHEFSDTQTVLLLNKRDVFHKFLGQGYSIANAIDHYPRLYSDAEIHDYDFQEWTQSEEFAAHDAELFAKYQYIPPNSVGHEEVLIDWIVDWFYFPLRHTRVRPYVHVTIATDTDFMRTVINELVNFMTQAALRRGNLL